MAENRTENDALIELARSAGVESTFIDGSDHVVEVVLPPGHEQRIVDLEKYQPQPRRKQEEVDLHDADSFGAYVVRHRIEEATTLYADLATRSVVAVLNDSAQAEPGWGDHRANLKLKHTDPWNRWTSLDGKPLTQEKFAEHVEQSLPEFTRPPAAEMYELAQTFQATIGANFRQTGKLQSGQRALHYEENIEASAGDQGDLTVPKEFHLRLQVFEGGESYDLVARLRYRVTREGTLTLSYHLVRPEDVVKEAFDATLDEIEEATKVAAFRGTPPVRPGA